MVELTIYDKEEFVRAIKTGSTIELFNVIQKLCAKAKDTQEIFDYANILGDFLAELRFKEAPELFNENDNYQIILANTLGYMHCIMIIHAKDLK